MKKNKLIIPIGVTSLLFVVIIVFSLVTNLTKTNASNQSLKVQFYNGNTSNISNTLYLRFQLVNTGTSPIPLTQVQVKYYYTEEGTQAQHFWCDWATVGSRLVTGTFGQYTPVTQNADHYFAVGFAGGAGNLAPNASTQVQIRIAKANWSSYTQRNDYSFNGNASKYVDWKNVTASIQGSQLWGTAPDGTGSQQGGGAIQLPNPGTSVPATTTPTVQASPGVTPTVQASPGVTPTVQASPTIVATQQPTQTGSNAYRYFAAGTSVGAIQAGARNLSKQQVKVLIEKEIDGSWSIIQSDLGFSTKEKAYAFFLGLASRESTLNAGLETGNGPSHSYGALQAAETAYINTKGYLPENNVPEMTQFSLTPQNFYDPGISIYMGIRHVIHYNKQAKAAGYTGTQLLRHELIGYNTGSVTNSNASWLVQYSDEIGSLAGWYLANGHLYDTQFTWTGDPRVNRSQPWGWY
jgi:hypothetical protein